MAAIAALSSGRYIMGNCSNNLSITHEYIPEPPFYGGLTKKKNVKHNVLNFNSILIIAVIWVCYGYQVAFGSSIWNNWITNKSVHDRNLT